MGVVRTFQKTGVFATHPVFDNPHVKEAYLGG